MNKRLLLNILGKILLIEAGAMALSLAVSLYYRDGDTLAFVKTIGLTVLVAAPMRAFSRPRDLNLRAREGFVAVGAAWVLMSFFGSLPFVFSGLIPDVPRPFLNASAALQPPALRF